VELISAGVDVDARARMYHNGVHLHENQDLLATTGWNWGELAGEGHTASSQGIPLKGLRFAPQMGYMHYPVSGQLDYPERHALSVQMHAVCIPGLLQ
jgi:hypothetical protein